jgi:hypothetical protein
MMSISFDTICTGMKLVENGMKLSGGQVVASSNLAVPTIENKGSWHFCQGLFLSGNR